MKSAGNLKSAGFHNDRSLEFNSNGRLEISDRLDF